MHWKKITLLRIFLAAITLLMLAGNTPYLFAQGDTAQDQSINQSTNISKTGQSLTGQEIEKAKELISGQSTEKANKESKTDQTTEKIDKKTSSEKGTALSETTTKETPAATEAAPSRIEAILSRGVTETLSQYGYSFFAKGSHAFEPMINVPVGSDYVIGPGDSFTINLWGNTEDAYKVTVTRDGNITLPRLGTLNVNSLTFAELKDLLGNKFKEYYPNFEMNVTMDSLRTIEIFMVGEANNPGTYSVSSLSTIITALYATGGPSKNGSIRNIKLIRNNKTVSTLDLYDFFIKGVKDNDMRLQAGDTIFIPMIEPVIGIAGYVKRPAIYEMKGTQTVGDVIDMAGGVLPISYLQNVVIERVTDHKRRIIKSFNIDPKNKDTNDNLNMQLQDEDFIRIYPIYKGISQVVYVEGHVKYPQEYEFKDGMKVRDLVPSYNALLSEPYLPLAEIVRLMPPDNHPEIIQFNLGALMSGDETQNLKLQDSDRVIIYSKWDKKDRPSVTIKGAVRAPGSYTLLEGMTIKDLIFKAGNLTDTAYMDKADLTRFTEVGKGVETLTREFSVKNALSGNDKDNMKLQPDDVIQIREIPQYREALARKVYMQGEFLFPGEYSFSEGESLSSVIQRTGGFTKSAYPFAAIFQREGVKETQRKSMKDYIDRLEKDILSLTAMAGDSVGTTEMAAIQTTLAERKALLDKMRSAEPTGRLVIDLNDIISGSSDNDFILQAGDKLIVPKRQDYINVLGEVYNPTAIIYKKGMKVSYYLDKVGGIASSADKKQLYIVKADGTIISKRQGGLFGLGFWDENNSRWSFGRFASVELDPGDAIIVPQKVITIKNWWTDILNTTTVLYQLAVAAKVIADF